MTTKICKTCNKVYNIPVYHADGTRISNTTPSRARRLIKSGVARKVFINNMFSLQLTTDTRKEKYNEY
jgi:hypothetical protein